MLDELTSSESCSSCKHWKEEIDPDYPEIRWCGAINDTSDSTSGYPEALAFCGGYSGLATRAEFGCVLHEETDA